MTSLRGAVCSLALLVSAAACALGEQQGAADSTTLGSTGEPGPNTSAALTPPSGTEGSPADLTPTAPVASTSAAPTPRPDAAEVTLEEVGRADQPVGLLWARGKDPYVIERPGRIVPLGGGEPLLDISERTTTDGERGLLGAVLSPDGAWLYASFTGTEGDSRVEAFPVSRGRADAAAGRELLRVEQPFSNHNGGHLVFGPDNLLYLGLGDGGSGGDPEENGQDPTTLLGSLLRVEPTPQGDEPYRIPASNPLADGGRGRAEIVAIGLRNPWRFSFDRRTDELWIADVGQSAVEEIDRVGLAQLPGANFGWDDMEGDRPFEGGRSESFVAPVFTYSHEQGCSVTGGYVYRGRALPALRGAYLYGDLCDGTVRALAPGPDGQLESFDLRHSVSQLVSFAQAPDGELYVLSLAGPIFRLVPAGRS